LVFLDGETANQIHILRSHDDDWSSYNGEAANQIHKLLNSYYDWSS